MRARAAQGFKERGFALFIGEAGARTITLLQKPAQLLRRGLPLWEVDSRRRKRAQADGLGVQYLASQNLFNH